MGKVEGGKMSLPQGMDAFHDPLESISRLLKRFNDRGVVIGGIAASLLGKPRFTLDVDAVFLLAIEELPEFMEAASAQGITPRIQDAEVFARKNRVLLLKHTATDTNIDISLGILPFEQEMVERSEVKSIGALSIRLPTPEDLIITKAIAHRPRDMEDIRTIVEKHPGLDVARIEKWVRAFAEALDMPDLWADTARLLGSSASTKPGF